MRADPAIGVVVGGGNGIGAACCRVMKRQGWCVVVVDRDGPAAAAVAEEVEGHAFEADIRDEEAIMHLAERIERDVGRAEGLVVSSGTFQDNIPVSETSPETLDRVLDVNFRGTYHLNRIFGLRMAALRRGSIVNLSSVTGQVSTPLNVYGPSKAAIISLTKSLAGEWGRSGVRVNSVSPGITLVPRVVERRRRSTRYTGDIDTHMALGRCVEPPEVAEAVEFLLSSRASAITGTDLVVDCGWITASLWHTYGGVRPPLDP